MATQHDDDSAAGDSDASEDCGCCVGGRIISLTVGRITLMLESLIECLGRSIDAASSFGVSLRSQLVEKTSTSGGKCALKCTDISESELLRCVLESTPRM